MMPPKLAWAVVGVTFAVIFGGTLIRFGVLRLALLLLVLAATALLTTASVSIGQHMDTKRHAADKRRATERMARYMGEASDEC